MPATARTPLRSQTSAVRALLALIDRFPDLPAADVHVQAPNALERLAIHVHNDPAGFEMWREALNLDPAESDLSEFPDFIAIKVRGDVMGISVYLAGFLPLPADRPTVLAA